VPGEAPVQTIAVAVAVAVAFVLVFLAAPATNQRPETDFGRIALRRSLVGNLLAVLVSASPYIWAMGWTALDVGIFLTLSFLLIFIFTAWLAWPAAIRAILSRKQVIHGIGGLLLSLSTLPVGYFTSIAFLKILGPLKR
jgi:hypothetical protein